MPLSCNFLSHATQSLAFLIGSYVNRMYICPCKMRGLHFTPQETDHGALLSRGGRLMLTILSFPYATAGWRPPCGQALPAHACAAAGAHGRRGLRAHPRERSRLATAQVKPLPLFILAGAASRAHARQGAQILICSRKAHLATAQL